MRLQTIAWAAFAADVGIILTLGALTPGHNHIHDYVSTLGAVDAPNGGLYRLGAVIAAALHLWFFVRLWPHVTRGLGALALGLFIAFMLLHLVAAAAFPCDPDCMPVTVPGTIHYSMGFAAFCAYGIGVILWSVNAYRQGWPTAIHWPALGIVLTALWLLYADATLTWNGAAERANIVALGWWIVTLPRSLPTRPD